jgi:hypothetical protein
MMHGTMNVTSYLKLLAGILIWIDAMVQFTDVCLVNYSVFNPPVLVVRRHQI